MQTIPPESRFYLLPCARCVACHAISLTSNETIFCQTVKKAATIKLYLADAAKLEIFKNLPDPRLGRISFVKNILI